LFHQPGIVSTTAQPAASQTAATGVRVRLESRCHRPLPGIAPSRLNAQICREFEVMFARPQNSSAITGNSSSSFAPVSPTASTRICAGGTLAADSVFQS
jgi:hypothetical protein